MTNTSTPTIWYSDSVMPFEALRAKVDTSTITDAELFEDVNSPYYRCNVWCRNQNFPYFIPSDGTYNLKLSQPLEIVNRPQTSIRSNGQPHESDDLPMDRPAYRREIVSYFRRAYRLSQ